MTTITLQEHGCEPREVVTCRIPCQYEFLTLGEERWKVTSVTHLAIQRTNFDSSETDEPSAVCNVMRLGEQTP